MCCNGGGRFESSHPIPLPPTRPPKLLVPAFLQFEILVKLLAPWALKNCFWLFGGVKIFFTLCGYTQNSLIFVENFVESG